jgi:hypothetical protein
MRFATKPSQAPKPKLRVPKSDAIKAKDVDTKTKELKKKPTTKLKTKTGTELALVSVNGNKPVAIKDPEVVMALNSRFGTQADTIVEMISMGNADGASSLIIKALIQSVCEVLPMAEHHIRESKSTKGIYGFNTLVSTVRELLGDLQVLKDKANLGQSIVDRTIRPSYMDIASQLVTSMTLVQESAKGRMDKEDFKEFRVTVEQAKKGMADYMMAQYRDVSEQVVKSLG